MQIPGEISWTTGFARFTVERRFRHIAEIVAGGGSGFPAAADCAVGVADAALSGGRVRTDGLTAPTGHWARWLDEQEGRPYRDLSFFEIEFLYYHVINSHCGAYATGADPFAPRKRADAHEAAGRVEAAARLLGGPRPAGPGPALRLALHGNRVDLSQLAAGGGAADDSLVVDHLDRVTAELTRPGPAEIDYLADNAGTELAMDLLLIDLLLGGSAGTVVRLHVKPWPMFVSDATEADLAHQLECWRRAPAGSAVRAAAGRLDGAIADGRLLVRAEADWGEPRHFDALRDGLARTLRSARLVIAKGDLNYRRHFGDRAWRTDTPPEAAARGVGFPSALLRVLKSEIAVGVDPDRRAELDRRDPGWMHDGSFSMVQCLAPPEVGCSEG